MKRSIAFESAGSAAKRPEICLDLLDLPQTVLEILVRYALESIGSTCRRVRELARGVINIRLLSVLERPSIRCWGEIGASYKLLEYASTLFERRILSLEEIRTHAVPLLELSGIYIRIDGHYPLLQTPRSVEYTRVGAVDLWVLYLSDFPPISIDLSQARYAVKLARIHLMPDHIIAATLERYCTIKCDPDISRTAGRWLKKGRSLDILGAFCRVLRPSPAEEGYNVRLAGKFTTTLPSRWYLTRVEEMIPGLLSATKWISRSLLARDELDEDELDLIEHPIANRGFESGVAEVTLALRHLPVPSLTGHPWMNDFPVSRWLNHNAWNDPSCLIVYLRWTESWWPDTVDRHHMDAAQAYRMALAIIDSRHGAKGFRLLIPRITHRPDWMRTVHPYTPSAKLFRLLEAMVTSGYEDTARTMIERYEGNSLEFEDCKNKMLKDSEMIASFKRRQFLE